MRGLRRLSVVILMLALGYQAPGLVLAACQNGVSQCSSSYGMNESEIGAGGPANQSTQSHSTTYYDGGSNVGDIAVGTTQSGSANNSAGGNVLGDDFETWSGWSAYGSGTVAQSNAAQHRGQYALLKSTNADPNGGYKLLGSSVSRDWRIDTWVMSTASGQAASLGIENSSYNGYSLSVTFGTGTNNLVIQKRTAGVAATLGTAGSYTLNTNTWYHVVFGSNGSANSLTLQILDANSNVAGSATATDTTYTGANDRVVVHGGFPYYVDDLNIYNSGVGYQTAAGFDTPVAPTLTFLVNTSLVNLGLLTYSNPVSATASFSVINYTGYGYVVQSMGNPPSIGGSPGHTLSAMNGTSTPGTEQFGINLTSNNVSGATPTAVFGSGPAQNPDSTYAFGQAASGYGTPNKFKYTNGDVIAQALKSSGETDYTISYLINISTQTPAGLYQMNQTLVCTGTY